MHNIKDVLKKELKAAKVFDSYFYVQDIDKEIKSIRPYSPRTIEQIAATKLANQLDAKLLKIPKSNGGVSAVLFIYALVEIKFRDEIQLTSAERSHYDKLLDDLICRIDAFDHYPNVIFGADVVDWST